MKIALCLFGEPRHIENEIASNLYQAFIINKYDVDIYGHTWIANSYHPSSWNNYPEIKSTDNIEKRIRDQYPGIKLVADFAKCFDSEYRDRNNIISQVYSINSVAELINNPEQYRFIIFGRYDLLLTRFEDISNLCEGFYGTIRHPSLADQLIFCSPKFLPAFKMYENILKEDKLKDPTFSIEEFKLTQYARLFPNIAVLKHDFTVSLIRTV